MKKIRVLFSGTKKDDAKTYGCMECQSSCQSACKTSCTIGNQTCKQKEERVNHPKK